MVVGGDDGDFVGIVAGQVGVDEDKDIGDCLSEWEGLFEDGPGAGVCVEDYG